MLHFCTSKTAWNFFGHLTLTTFSFVSLIFIFFFFFFVGQNWVTIRCTSAWQGVRELVCVRVQPPKNAQNTYIVHIPPLAGNWARKKIDFPQFSRFLAAVCVLCALLFGVLRVLFGLWIRMRLISLESLYIGINFVRVSGWERCLWGGGEWWGAAGHCACALFVLFWHFYSRWFAAASAGVKRDLKWTNVFSDTSWKNSKQRRNFWVLQRFML